MYIKEKFWFMWDNNRCDYILPFFLPIYHAGVLRWFIFGIYIMLLMLATGYGCYSGNSAPYELILELGFVVIITLAANFIFGLLFFMWQDLVKMRRNQGSDTLSIIEVIKGEINFEWWCC